MTARLISVVLPVHNQADHIAPVVEGYEEVFARIERPHELILVNNGSRDNSLDRCHALADRFPTVRAFDAPRGGWGLAVQRGLGEARGDVLAYTNSARTSPQDLLLLVIYAIANPGAFVKAHRHSRDSLARKLGSFLYNFECRGLFALATWDVNATPKVFSREIYEALQPKSEGDLIDLEIYVKCKRLGIVTLEVPIYARSRSSGESTTNLRSAARMYWGAFQMARALRDRER